MKNVESVASQRRKLSVEKSNFEGREAMVARYKRASIQKLAGSSSQRESYLNVQGRW